MYLNLDRVELQRASGMLTAITAAISGSVPKEIFDATTDTPEEAEALFQLAQSRAEHQRDLGGDW